MAKVVDPELLKMLKQCKLRSRNFVLVVKSANAAGLFLSKKRIPPRMITEMKQEVGGKRVFQGTVVGEGSTKLIFNVIKEEPTNGKKILRDIIAEQCGLKLRPEFRVVQKIEWIDDNEPDPDVSDIEATPKAVDELAGLEDADSGKDASPGDLKKYKEQIAARQKSLVKGIGWIKDTRPDGGDEVVAQVKRVMAAAKSAKSVDKLKGVVLAYDAVLGNLRNLMKAAKSGKATAPSEAKADYSKWDSYKKSFEQDFESYAKSPFVKSSDVKKVLGLRSAGDSGRKVGQHDQALAAYDQCMELHEQLVDESDRKRTELKDKREADAGWTNFQTVMKIEVLKGRYPTPTAKLAAKLKAFHAKTQPMLKTDKGVAELDGLLKQAAALVKEWLGFKQAYRAALAALKKFSAATKAEVNPAIILAKSANLPEPLKKLTPELFKHSKAYSTALAKNDPVKTLAAAKLLYAAAKALNKVHAALQKEKVKYSKACKKLVNLGEFWKFSKWAKKAGYGDAAFKKQTKLLSELSKKINAAAHKADFAGAIKFVEQAVAVYKPLHEAWQEYDQLNDDITNRWGDIEDDVIFALGILDISAEVKQRKKALSKLYKAFKKPWDAYDPYKCDQTLLALEAADYMWLADARDDFETAKKKFDDEWPGYEEDLKKTGTLRPKNKKTQQQLAAVKAAEKAVLDAVKVFEYDRAFGLLNGIAVAVAAIWKQFVKQYDAAEKIINANEKAYTKIKRFYNHTEALKDKKSEVWSVQYDCKEHLKEFEFVQCGAECKKFTVALKAYLAEVKAYDKQAKKDAKDARKKIAKLAKSGALKSASLDTKKDLLAKVQSVVEMSKDEMKAQVEIYNSLEVDEDFKQENNTRRKDITKDLTGSKTSRDELRDARDNWGSKSDDEKLAVIKKALKAQCKAMGITGQAPGLVLDTEATSGDAHYSPSEKKIYIKTHAKSDFSRSMAQALDAVFHENSHHYQIILIERLNSGALKPGDKEYKQAVMFAMNEGPHGYVTAEDNHEVYKSQPQEDQAWDNGEQTSKAVMDALKKKKKKKSSSKK